LINAPDAIHRVLVDNAANYCRTSATIRILRPIVGQGLLLSEGEGLAAPAPHQCARHGAACHSHDGAACVAGHRGNNGAARSASRPAGPSTFLPPIQFLALEIAARSMFSLEMRQYGAALLRLITRFAGSLGRPYFLDLMLPAAIPTPRDFARMRFPVAMGRLPWTRSIAARLAAPQADHALCGKPPRSVRHAACGARSRNRGGVLNGLRCATRWRP